MSDAVTVMTPVQTHAEFGADLYGGTLPAYTPLRDSCGSAENDQSWSNRDNFMQDDSSHSPTVVSKPLRERLSRCLSSQFSFSEPMCTARTSPVITGNDSETSVVEMALPPMKGHQKTKSRRRHASTTSQLTLDDLRKELFESLPEAVVARCERTLAGLMSDALRPLELFSADIRQHLVGRTAVGTDRGLVSDAKATNEADLSCNANTSTAAELLKSGQAACSSDRCCNFAEQFASLHASTDVITHELRTLRDRLDSAPSRSRAEAQKKRSSGPVIKRLQITNPSFGVSAMPKDAGARGDCCVQNSISTSQWPTMVMEATSSKEQMASDVTSAATSDIDCARSDDEQASVKYSDDTRGVFFDGVVAKAVASEGSTGCTSRIDAASDTGFSEAGKGRVVTDVRFSCKPIYSTQVSLADPSDRLLRDEMDGGAICTTSGDDVGIGDADSRGLRVAFSGDDELVAARPWTEPSVQDSSCAAEASRSQDVCQKQQQLACADANVDDGCVSNQGGSCNGGASHVRRRMSKCEKSPSTPKWIVWVKSDAFESLAAFAVVLSTIILGVQTNAEAQHPFESTSVYFVIIDIAFAFFFTTELALRLLAYDFTHFFYGPSHVANRFDTVMVATTLLDLCTTHLVSETTVFSYLEAVGAVRLLRLGKLMRLLRVVSLIQELKMMVYLICASVQSFFWALALMVMMIYLVALYFTEVVTKMVRDGVHSEEAVKSQWGSVGSSILSLFMSISGGDDWSTFLETVGADSGVTGFVNTSLFSLYVAFMVLVTMNLVTGVFVEGAQRLISNDKDEEFLRKTNDLFGVTDSDDDLEMTWEQFESLLSSEAIVEFFKSIEFNQHAAWGLFQLLDENRSGTLSMKEFVMGCMRLRGPARSVDLVHLVINIAEIERERQQQNAEQRKMMTHLLHAVDSLGCLKGTVEAHSRHGDSRLPCLSKPSNANADQMVVALPGLSSLLQKDADCNV
eukprot:TRINITY_DN4218_c0_g2_i2.p1 TRINITY_DN4218_c0_g2~~TRINITY_DN4218_c0_g2_i2.p1  ORF type:complete len:970 (+),score=161.45 TRINITY_DN4218_c0_g2_i2:171-3080(+)